MPGFNQTGPEGMGAMTGRQRGMCRRTDNQTLRGDGSGRGRGKGMRCGLGQDQNMGKSRSFDRGQQSTQNITGNSPEQLRELKEQYQEAKKMLTVLEEKIGALQGAK